MSPAQGKRKGQFAVVLIGNWRLVFEPDPPVKEHINLADVRKIRLLEVWTITGSKACGGNTEGFT